MATNNVNKPTGEEQKLLSVQSGIQAAIPVGSAVVVGGTSYTQPQLLTKVGQLLAPFQPCRDAKAALTAAVAAKRQNQPVVQSFLVEFRAAMIALFGRGNPTLAKFGIQPTKAKTTTAGAKVIKAAKAKATRKLLGTKGKVQKADVLASQGATAVAVSPTGEILPATGAGSSATASAPAAPTGVTGGSTGSGQ
ncbi:MAG: hypothetical protein ACYDCL_22920 [Myxococcales bacterium]